MNLQNLQTSFIIVQIRASNLIPPRWFPLSIMRYFVKYITFFNGAYTITQLACDLFLSFLICKKTDNQ